MHTNVRMHCADPKSFEGFGDSMKDLKTGTGSLRLKEMKRFKVLDGLSRPS